MNNLFYSPTENIIFQIVGYSAVDSTSAVHEIIERLKKEADEFSAIAGVEYKDVRSDYIKVSQRYKNMRVYYSHAKVVPDSAFSISERWNFSKWCAG